MGGFCYNPGLRLSRGGGGLASALSLDFTTGILDPRITFTRASTATRVNSIGVIETVAINGPRFDYNPVTLLPKGLLREEQRTNICLYSSDLTAWTTISAAVTADASPAPTGNNTADLLYPSSTGTFRGVYQAGSSWGAGGAALTMSVFVEAAGMSWVMVGDNTNVADVAWFNLATGVVGSKGANITSHAIVDYGGGVYRCTITRTSVSLRYPSVFVCDGDNTSTATASGTNGVYVWGAQLEVGAFPTSYIPTVASTVTRSADDASMTGTNFSSWYNQSEGTFVVDATPAGNYGQSAAVVYANTSGFSDSVGITKANTINSSVGKYWVGALYDGTSNIIPSTTESAVARSKLALAYKLNDVAFAVDGSIAGTDTSATIPTATNRLHIGGRDSGGLPLNGHVRTIQYYNTRLPNATLQSLTA